MVVTMLAKTVGILREPGLLKLLILALLLVCTFATSRDGNVKTTLLKTEFNVFVKKTREKFKNNYHSKKIVLQPGLKKGSNYFAMTGGCQEHKFRITEIQYTEDVGSVEDVMPLLVLERIRGWCPWKWPVRSRDRYLNIQKGDGAEFLELCLRLKDERTCNFKIKKTTKEELKWLVKNIPQDPNVYTHEFETQKKRRAAVIKQGNQLERKTETLFRTEGLPETFTGGGKGKAVALFKRDWKTPGLKSYKTKSRTERTIRVCQFNILAHGLASPSAGFAYHFKPDAPKDKCAVEQGDTTSDIGLDYYEDLKAAKVVLGEFTYNPGDKGKQFENGYLPVNDSKKYYKWIPKPNGEKDEQVPGGKLNKKYYETTGSTLPMPTRLERALGIILRQSPDIITIQELDHFKSFESILKDLGYKGMINKKKTDCPGAPYNGGNGPDGTAIFWNDTRFELSKEGNDVSEYKITPPKVSIEETEENTYKAKYVEAQFDEDGNLLNEGVCGSQRLLRVRLKVRKTGKPFAVLTGHFKAGSKVKDRPEQLLQAQKVIDLLREDRDKPVIFACDFNNNMYTDAMKHFWEEHNKFFDEEDGLESAYPLHDIRVGDYVTMEDDQNANVNQGNEDSEEEQKKFYPNDFAFINTKEDKHFAQAAEVIVMDPEGLYKGIPEEKEDEKDDESSDNAEKIDVVHVREVVAGKCVGKTHIIPKSHIEKVELFKVKKVEGNTADVVKVTLHVNCKGKNAKNQPKLKYIIDGKTMTKSKLSNLRNRTRLSCVKWRRGGSQPEKVNKVMETIDYIFSKGFETKAFLELPEVKKVLEATNGMGIPHLKYPSDHFMLAADLELKDGANYRLEKKKLDKKDVVKPDDYIKRFDDHSIPFLKKKWSKYAKLFKKKEKKPAVTEDTDEKDNCKDDKLNTSVNDMQKSSQENNI